MLKTTFYSGISTVMGTSDELTILEKLQPIRLEWVEASLFKIP